VSWDDPDDWHSFEAAVDAAATRDSWGIGYVVAQDNDDYARGLYGCLDLDGCLEEPYGSAKDWLPSLSSFFDDEFYLEFSASGEGIHIPIVGQDVPEWWTDSDFDDREHEGVEFLTHKFVAFTGDQLRGSGSTVCDADPTEFLRKSYEAIRGEPPKVEQHAGGSDHTVTHTPSEVADIETTDDMDVIIDAVEHTTPRDIRIRSPVTQEYSGGKDINYARDPSWTQSKSGTRIAEFDDGFVNRDGMLGLDCLQLVALEERIISRPDEYPEGERFLEAVDALRDRGADIPEYEESQTTEPRTAGDGGTDVETAETDADSGADNTDLGSGLDWRSVYNGYRTASDADERLVHRYEATELLSENHHWRNVAETDILWSYDHDEGIFKPDGEQHCRQVLVDNLREQFRAHEHSEVCTQLRGRTTVREAQMGGPAEKIACANGVLDLETNPPALEDHAPEYEFLSALGTEYDPEASCPRFEQFLRETVPDPSDRLKLQEFAGYCLMHWQLPHHKGLFLVGPTASGKSTFLDTIRAMLGGDTTASLTPQQMTSERFGGAELYGAWANIRNDIPAQMIDNTGTFKELVAGDPVKAEKKFKDPFMFSPTAKHLFSANQLPEASTDDEAFYRRILLVAFPETIPRSERDSRLDDKLERELPGILNWALDGLERMRAEGGFTGDRPPGQTQETWEKWCNSVKRFVQVCVEEAGDETLPKSDAYHAYRAFCDGEGIPVETQHKFTRDFKNYSGYEDGRTYVGAGGGRERIRVFFDCQLTGRGEEFLEDYTTTDDDDSATGDGGSGVTDY
jgi:putative DNA primase/helicase